jgi:SpoVK/Ycf46/Vps4 family AAA+-type ATPase
MTVDLPRVNLNDLILSDKTLKQIRQLGRELYWRKELLKRELPPRSRLLFFGPPGNGKSACAAALAGALGIDGHLASIPTTVSSNCGATGENLDEAFDVLRDGNLLVVDEIDGIGSVRNGITQVADKEFNNQVNSLLTLMDQVKTGVFVGTTNRPELLDPALLRRFDIRVEFPRPTDTTARKLAKHLCQKHHVPFRVPRTRSSFDAIVKEIIDVARERVLAELERSHSRRPSLMELGQCPDT